MRDELIREVNARWPGRVRVQAANAGSPSVLAPALPTLPELCGWLFLQLGFSFAGLTVEEQAERWELRYAFYGDREAGWIFVVLELPLDQLIVPSIVKYVHAADWHEREAEDLFGLVFEGHPRLGDFVLHDDAWQEGVEPMRHSFSAQTPVTDRRPQTEWRPHRVLEAPGAFVMPIGPVYTGASESAHFLLETVGEDVTRAVPRLFYTYRGTEKIAEERGVPNVLLLAERFAATTAFAHGLAYSRAVEAICRATVSERAEALRVFVAELERFRHHVGAVEGICESTGLVVAASQAGMLEEDLLRVSGALTGHRYLFGLVAPGGLTVDLDDAACRDAMVHCRTVLDRLNGLEEMLRYASSFLDRLEEAGYILERDARVFGLVGPIARASGIATDLRVAQPYGAYGDLEFDVPVEREGDGYARLRILFAEARESVRLMVQVLDAMRDGPVRSPIELREGAAMGWVEAPRGGAFHWVRLGANGTVTRYHIVPPSFINFLGFRLAVEKFTFQDFPIILSTLDLSVAENDR